MPVTIDVPSNILNHERNCQIVAGIAGAVAAAVVGMVFYCNDGGDQGILFGSLLTFLALQPLLAYFTIQAGPTAFERRQICSWIRTYGPDLHQRVLADIRLTGALIGSPYMVTYFAAVAKTDLSDAQLGWAIESELYDLKEVKILRLMKMHIARYGHAVGYEERIFGTEVQSLPYFAISAADIAACDF